MEMSSVRVMAVQEGLISLNEPGAAPASAGDHGPLIGRPFPNSPDDETGTTATPSPSYASPLFASSPESWQGAGHSSVAAPSSLPHPASNHADEYLIPMPGGIFQTWSRAQVMKSLKDSVPHKMRLRQLQNCERQFYKDGSCHNKAVRRISKSLYIVLGMYAVLQSAIFAAVAQTDLFGCDDSWGPASIAFMVAMAMLKTTVDKLRSMGMEQDKARQFKARQNAVWDHIAMLYLRGSACDLDSLEPDVGDLPTDDSLLCVFSPYGILVLGFLAGFSVLISVSCVHVLCNPCKCH